jgi:hypothetical protein
MDLARLDLGSPDLPPMRVGCAKVDFLFVVDGSGSMLAHQEQLTRSFPEFVAAIEDTLQVDDFHILVTDTDAEPGDCYAICDGTVALCNHAACAGLPRQGTCEATLGGGRVTDTQGNMCPVAGPQRYLVRGQPMLADTFSCIATIGGGQSEETQMAALTAALGRDLNAAGGCNAGFVRDDAILVVTLITDESDRFSPGYPMTWYQAVLDAKGGDDSAIVVLGIIGTDSRLRAFVMSFASGMLAGIDEADYGPFFLDAVDDIDLACRTFVPAG